MGEPRTDEQRPLGIKITALMFFLLGAAVLIGNIAVLGGEGVQFTVAPLLIGVLFSLLCFLTAAGVFLKKAGGRWLAFALTALIACGEYLILLNKTGFYSFRAVETLVGGIWMTSLVVGTWVAMLLPFAVLYFLLFDKATVAAFKKLPAPPAKS